MLRKAIIVIFWWPLSLHAQIVSPWEVDTENFLFRIKNIEFFIDRFNNQNDPVPSNVDRKDSVAYLKFIKQRTASLVSLFDQARIRDKSQKSFRERAGRFIQWINDPVHPSYLHFADSGWFAEATVTCTYLGKPSKLMCILQVTRTPAGGYQWSLRSMKLQESDLKDRFEKTQVIFPPSAHGTDFISLSQMLKDERFIDKMIQTPEFTIWPLIKNKKLVPGPVSFIRYHFLQVKDWLMTSEYVNRASKNAGWLVREVMDMDESQKFNYITNLRGY